MSRLRDVRLRLVVVVVGDEVLDRVVRERSSRNSWKSCAASVLLWDSTSVGRLTASITLAMVKVLPEPVTPSSTCSASPRSQALGQLGDRLRLIALGRERRNELEAVQGAGGLGCSAGCPADVSHGLALRAASTRHLQNRRNRLLAASAARPVESVQRRYQAHELFAGQSARSGRRGGAVSFFCKSCRATASSSPLRMRSSAASKPASTRRLSESVHPREDASRPRPGAGSWRRRARPSP